MKSDWKESIKNINRLKNKYANTIHIDLFDIKLYEMFYNRYKAMVKDIKNSLNYDIESIILRLSWRLLINFGIEDTHETSIFLDRKILIDCFLKIHFGIFLVTQSFRLRGRFSTPLLLSSTITSLL